MEASESLWRPLGSILVERGLLTEPQLEHALGEQERTGGRLGEVLVGLDLVPAEVLVPVLLEQCGVGVETQNGFGSGLLSELQKRGSAHRRVAPQPVFAAPEPEKEPRPAASPKPRRFVRRRKRKQSRERAEQLTAALATLEQKARELQDDLLEVRRILAEVSR